MNATPTEASEHPENSSLFRQSSPPHLTPHKNPVTRIESARNNPSEQSASNLLETNEREARSPVLTPKAASITHELNWTENIQRGEVGKPKTVDVVGTRAQGDSPVAAKADMHHQDSSETVTSLQERLQEHLKSNNRSICRNDWCFLCSIAMNKRDYPSIMLLAAIESEVARFRLLQGKDLICSLVQCKRGLDCFQLQGLKMCTDAFMLFLDLKQEVGELLGTSNLTKVSLDSPNKIPKASAEKEQEPPAKVEQRNSIRSLLFEDRTQAFCKSTMVPCCVEAPYRSPVGVSTKIIRAEAHVMAGTPGKCCSQEWCVLRTATMKHGTSSTPSCSFAKELKEICSLFYALQEEEQRHALIGWNCFTDCFQLQGMMMCKRALIFVLNLQQGHVDFLNYSKLIKISRRMPDTKFLGAVKFFGNIEREADKTGKTPYQRSLFEGKVEISTGNSAVELFREYRAFIGNTDEEISKTCFTKFWSINYPHIRPYRRWGKAGATTLALATGTASKIPLQQSISECAKETTNNAQAQTSTDLERRIQELLKSDRKPCCRNSWCLLGRIARKGRLLPKWLQCVKTLEKEVMKYHFLDAVEQRHSVLGMNCSLNCFQLQGIGMCTQALIFFLGLFNNQVLVDFLHLSKVIRISRYEEKSQAVFTPATAVAHNQQRTAVEMNNPLEKMPSSLYSDLSRQPTEIATTALMRTNENKRKTLRPARETAIDSTGISPSSQTLDTDKSERARDSPSFKTTKSAEPRKGGSRVEVQGVRTMRSKLNATRQELCEPIEAAGNRTKAKALIVDNPQEKQNVAHINLQSTKAAKATGSKSRDVKSPLAKSVAHEVSLESPNASEGSEEVIDDANARDCRTKDVEPSKGHQDLVESTETAEARSLSQPPVAKSITLHSNTHQQHQHLRSEREWNNFVNVCDLSDEEISQSPSSSSQCDHRDSRRKKKLETPQELRRTIVVPTKGCLFPCLKLHNEQTTRGRMASLNVTEPDADRVVLVEREDNGALEERIEAAVEEMMVSNEATAKAATKSHRTDAKSSDSEVQGVHRVPEKLNAAQGHLAELSLRPEDMNCNEAREEGLQRVARNVNVARRHSSQSTNAVEVTRLANNSANSTEARAQAAAHKNTFKSNKATEQTSFGGAKDTEAQDDDALDAEQSAEYEDSLKSTQPAEARKSSESKQSSMYAPMGCATLPSNPSQHHQNTCQGRLPTRANLFIESDLGRCFNQCLKQTPFSTPTDCKASSLAVAAADVRSRDAKQVHALNQKTGSLAMAHCFFERLYSKLCIAAGFDKTKTTTVFTRGGSYSCYLHYCDFVSNKEISLPLDEFERYWMSHFPYIQTSTRSFQVRLSQWGKTNVAENQTPFLQPILLWNSREKSQILPCTETAGDPSSLAKQTALIWKKKAGVLSETEAEEPPGVQTLSLSSQSAATPDSAQAKASDSPNVHPKIHSAHKDSSLLMELREGESDNPKGEMAIDDVVACNSYNQRTHKNADDQDSTESLKVDGYTTFSAQIIGPCQPKGSRRPTRTSLQERLQGHLKSNSKLCCRNEWCFLWSIATHMRGFPSTMLVESLEKQVMQFHNLRDGAQKYFLDVWNCDVDCYELQRVKMCKQALILLLDLKLKQREFLSTLKLNPATPTTRNLMEGATQTKVNPCSESSNKRPRDGDTEPLRARFDQRIKRARNAISDSGTPADGTAVADNTSCHSDQIIIQATPKSAHPPSKKPGTATIVDNCKNTKHGLSCCRPLTVAEVVANADTVEKPIKQALGSQARKRATDLEQPQYRKRAKGDIVDGDLTASQLSRSQVEEFSGACGKKSSDEEKEQEMQKSFDEMTLEELWGAFREQEPGMTSERFDEQVVHAIKEAVNEKHEELKEKGLLKTRRSARAIFRSLYTRIRLFFSG